MFLMSICAHKWSLFYASLPRVRLQSAMQSAVQSAECRCLKSVNTPLHSSADYCRDSPLRPLCLRCFVLVKEWKDRLAGKRYYPV